MSAKTSSAAAPAPAAGVPRLVAMERNFSPGVGGANVSPKKIVELVDVALNEEPVPGPVWQTSAKRRSSTPGTTPAPAAARPWPFATC